MTEQLNIKKYLLQGGAWAFTGKILTALMGLALSALLARLLSPEDMGGYFLAFNIATFCSIFARCGLENTLLRFISEAIGRGDSGYAQAVLRKGLITAITSASLIAVMVYFGIGQWVAGYIFQSNVLHSAIGFVSIWLVLLAFQVIFSEIFRAFHDIRSSVLCGGLFTATLTVIFLASYKLIALKATLNQILPWVITAGCINLLLAIWILYGKQKSRQNTSEKNISYKDLLEHSWPLLFNALAGFITVQSGLWILAAFQPDEEVAVYGAATRLVLLTGMALAVVNAVVPPLIARLNVQNQKDRLEEILRTTATLAAFPSFIILTVFIFYGEAVLDIVFGPYYRAGGMILAIISSGQAVNVFVGSCGYTLIMTGHRKAMMMISILSSSVMITCSLILVQKYEAIGVAIGMTTGVVLQQILMVGSCRHLCGIWTHAGIGCAFNALRKNKFI